MIPIPSRPVRFQTAEQGNDLSPLPPDYHELGDEAQRLARVNAVCLQETPEDLVRAWSFFRHTYLEPLPEGVWYQPPVALSPAAHYRLIYDIGKYARNIQGCPRGFGKSKLLKELLLLLMVSRPYLRVVLVKSVDDFVKDDFGELKFQIEENELLLRDFGDLKPKRGSGAWSDHRLWLRNGFQLNGRSIMSKMLGLRPDFFAFDDAEFDPAMRVSPTILTEQIKYLYYNHVRPAMRKGTSVLLLGTLLTRKTFIYYMAKTKEEDDSRVSFFNRVVLGARYPDGSLLWPEYWTEAILQEMKEEMGSTAFASQMMNEPGTEDERILTMHPRLSYYTVEDPEIDGYMKSPLSSELTMRTFVRVSTKPDGSEMDFKERILSGKQDLTEEIERPFGSSVESMTRVLLADPIRKPSAKSDFACLLVIGLERSAAFRDCWWVLDMKHGRPSESQFVKWVWDLGEKWRVRAVGIESASVQKSLVERTQIEFADRAADSGWMPRIYPIKYTKDTGRPFADPEKGKGHRIASVLGWRMEQYRVRFPAHLMGREPFSHLAEQVDDFTEDLRLLPKDDAIDTLAMTGFIVRSASKFAGPDFAQAEDAMSLLERGERFFPGTSIPLMAAVNASELTPAALEAIDSWSGRGQNSKRQRGRRPVESPRRRRRATRSRRGKILSPAA